MPAREFITPSLFTVPGRSKNTISGTCPVAIYSSAVAIAFWNMVDGREKTDLYTAYDKTIKELELRCV